MSNVVNVGVVAYDPKVVTIWEGIKEYFEANGVPMDFVLFSNYDAQVDALLKGWIDIAWNTNLAYVKVHRRTDGKCGVLAMRDTDVGFTSKIVAGAGTGVENLGGLKGKRVAFGSRDSGQARILPAYFLKRNGIDPARDITAIHFDLDVGKHGDTGTSEVEVLNSVMKGEAQAGAIGDQYWARALSENLVDSGKVRAIWTSPGYCHCNFTVRDKAGEQRFARWTDTLLAMDYNKPSDRKIMDMEGLKRWVLPELDGYRALFEAVDEFQFFGA
ncbi:MAG: phosphate ABC transporter substrate-binding protein [Acidobacteria bacterium]|nr:MAG: phosphate ABC transporter substrate-binding protein [Acidobacteriota bacterium]